jgi:hypothetical protein
MWVWHIYEHDRLTGLVPTKYRVIKRLEVMLARLLNDPADFIGKTEIRASYITARREKAF